MKSSHSVLVLKAELDVPSPGMSGMPKGTGPLLAAVLAPVSNEIFWAPDCGFLISGGEKAQHHAKRPCFVPFMCGSWNVWST